MGQNDNSTVSDTPSPSPHQALSAGVHLDAGFSHVGDRSGNTAWSQMTGATKVSPEQSLAGGASGAAVSPHESIDFAGNGDIYNQSDAHSHSGMPGGASPALARAGADAPLTPGGATNTAGGGDHRLAAGAPDLYAGGAAGSRDNGLTATDHCKISDGWSSNLEPSAGQSATGFERLSTQDQMQAPVDKLNATVTQNNQNLVQRIGELGDQLPRVAFHGATAQRAQMINDYFGSAGGGAEGEPSSPSIFVASPKTTASDPETRLGDLANAHAKAESYRQQGQPVYAFDMGGTRDSDYWTKRTEDTTSSAGGPFASTTKSYEAVLPLSRMQPLAQIPGTAADRLQPDPNAPDYLARAQALDVLHRQNAMDAVISAAEQKYY